MDKILNINGVKSSIVFCPFCSILCHECTHRKYNQDFSEEEGYVG